MSDNLDETIGDFAKKVGGTVAGGARKLTRFLVGNPLKKGPDGTYVDSEGKPLLGPRSHERGRQSPESKPLTDKELVAKHAAKGRNLKPY